MDRVCEYGGLVAERKRLLGDRALERYLMR